jgi:hypothetical protein
LFCRSFSLFSFLSWRTYYCVKFLSKVLLHCYVCNF